MDNVDEPQQLVKSRQRVADHGEVFTPDWLVDDMLNLVEIESERIDSRFLEPACGSGNFLKVVLERKLKTVKSRYGKSDFEKRHHALLALMCIYGIEFLEDNVLECREKLSSIFQNFIGEDPNGEWKRAGEIVLTSNVIHGDALTLTDKSGAHIEFPEWSYLGSGKFQRRNFRFDTLTQRSSIQGTLFEMLEEHDLFIPTRTYQPMKFNELSND